MNQFSDVLSHSDVDIKILRVPILTAAIYKNQVTQELIKSLKTTNDKSKIYRTSNDNWVNGKNTHEIHSEIVFNYMKLVRFVQVTYFIRNFYKKGSEAIGINGVMQSKKEYFLVSFLPDHILFTLIYDVHKWTPNM